MKGLACIIPDYFCDCPSSLWRAHTRLLFSCLSTLTLRQAWAWCGTPLLAPLLWLIVEEIHRRSLYLSLLLALCAVLIIKTIQQEVPGHWMKNLKEKKKDFEEQLTEVCDSWEGDSCVWSSLELHHWTLIIVWFARGTCYNFSSQFTMPHLAQFSLLAWWWKGLI